MRFDDLSFGSLRIDGVAYGHDVVVDRGKIRKRRKKPSRKFRGEFGHTPLSMEERIPWSQEMMAKMNASMAAILRLAEMNR